MADSLALHDAPDATSGKQVGDPYKPRFKAGNRKAITHLLIIQRQLLRDIESPDTEPHHRASCARAWTDCEERIRIIRGKPLPGAYKPVAKQPKQRPDSVLMQE